MKLEATKFRPREVVKHVLQTAAASLQKMLTLEGHVADDVPVEVSAFFTYYYFLTVSYSRRNREPVDLLFLLKVFTSWDMSLS